MSDRAAFTFTVLRYRHDLTTGEFVNVGVALHCAAHRFVGAKFGTPLHRLKAAFPSMNEWAMDPIVKRIGSTIQEAQASLSRSGVDAASSGATVMDFATAALPKDDSALQWATPGSGITVNPAKTLDDLFARYVGRDAEDQVVRSDDGVWATFSAQLQRAKALHAIGRVSVVQGEHSYEFAYGWRGKHLHCYVPLSLQLRTASAIEEKAFGILGRLAAIANTTEPVRLYFLYSMPDGSTSLIKAAEKAIQVLRRAPFNPEFFLEQDAEEFAKRQSLELGMHARKARSNGY